MIARLLTTFKIRDTEFKNSVFISPMCQYSAIYGVKKGLKLRIR